MTNEESTFYLSQVTLNHLQHEINLLTEVKLIKLERKVENTAATATISLILSVISLLLVLTLTLSNLL